MVNFPPVVFERALKSFLSNRACRHATRCVQIRSLVGSDATKAFQHTADECISLVSIVAPTPSDQQTVSWSDYRVERVEIVLTRRESEQARPTYLSVIRWRGRPCFSDSFRWRARPPTPRACFDATTRRPATRKLLRCRRRFRKPIWKRGRLTAHAHISTAIINNISGRWRRRWRSRRRRWAPAAVGGDAFGVAGCSARPKTTVCVAAARALASQQRWLQLLLLLLLLLPGLYAGASFVQSPVTVATTLDTSAIVPALIRFPCVSVSLLSFATHLLHLALPYH